MQGIIHIYVYANMYEYPRTPVPAYSTYASMLHVSQPISSSQIVL